MLGQKNLHKRSTNFENIFKLKISTHLKIIFFKNYFS